MLNVNEYFSGAVKSIGFTDKTGLASVGVMSAGEYTFNTSSAEIMHIISGSAQVKLSGTDHWQTISAGEHFQVEAHSSFLIKMTQDTAYLCEYR
ncbi:MAG: pyrimidine/purine nucleoside phosphorylase [Pseudomonas sp.]|nr:pyrimidine/purine nucleoside phosphorylase [Pseudomonas sp.]